MLKQKNLQARSANRTLNYVYNAHFQYTLYASLWSKFDNKNKKPNLHNSEKKTPNDTF